MLDKFNPRFIQFLKDNPDKTVLGVFWAGYWRVTLLIACAYFVLFLIFIGLD